MDAIFFPFEKIYRVYLDCFIIEFEIIFVCYFTGKYMFQCIKSVRIQVFTGPYSLV